MLQCVYIGRRVMFVISHFFPIGKKFVCSAKQHVSKPDTHQEILVVRQCLSSFPGNYLDDVRTTNEHK